MAKLSSKYVKSGESAFSICAGVATGIVDVRFFHKLVTEAPMPPVPKTLRSVFNDNVELISLVSCIGVSHRDSKPSLRENTHLVCNLAHHVSLSSL